MAAPTADGIEALFNIDGAVLSPLTNDPSGGSTTYGSAIKIPGMIELSMQPEFITKELNGDATIVDIYSKIKAVKGTIKHGKFALSLLAQMAGGTYSTSGSSPNTIAQYLQANSSLPGYFQIEGQCQYLGNDKIGADFHTKLYKCKLDKFALAQQDQNYAEVSFDYTAIPRLSDGNLFQFTENQTAIALAVGALPAVPSISSVVPADAASGVATSTTVTWTFALAINASCVVADNFVLVDVAVGTAIAGTLVYNSGAKTVTLTPTSNLTAGHTYLAIATTGVQDAFGQHMAAAVKSRFST